MSVLSLTKSEWILLRALVLDEADHTGIPSAEPVVERLGMATTQARDALDVLKDREMVLLHPAQGGLPYVQVTWRGRQEAAQRGESIPSPVEDAGQLLAFLRAPGDDVPDGSDYVDDTQIIKRFGWRPTQALDAARVLAEPRQIELHTPSGSFFVRLTALGRRSA